MNTEQALEQIAPKFRGVRARDFDPRDARIIAGEETLAIRSGRGHSIALAPEGIESLLAYTGISESLAKNLTPQTFAKAATEVLDHKRQGTLLVKEGQVVELTRSQYPAMDPERTLKTIEKRVDGADFHRILELPKHGIQLESVGVEERAVAKGDLVRAGALVQLSPFGTIQPLVQSYALRLICTNGATDMEVERRFSYGEGGEGDDVWQWFRRSISAAYKSIDRVSQRWQAMRQERIAPDQRASILEALLRESGLDRQVASAVRARALEQPPTNAWEMMNLITWASSHATDGGQAVYRAQLTAGRFAHEETHSQLCPTCRR